MTSADAKKFLMGQWAEFQDAIGDVIGPIQLPKQVRLFVAFLCGTMAHEC